MLAWVCGASDAYECPQREVQRAHGEARHEVIAHTEKTVAEQYYALIRCLHCHGSDCIVTKLLGGDGHDVPKIAGPRHLRAYMT
jgi:hypothetical protein